MTLGQSGNTVDKWRKALSAAGSISLETGLSDAEVDAAEATYDITFPDDLRACVQATLPVTRFRQDEPLTRGGFPNWRDLHNSRICLQLAWPWDGIVFDLERNSEQSWLPSWGERPAELGARIREVRRQLLDAPRLVPISGHRFLPCKPVEIGNPVLSVYQMDIIYYGSDLDDYLDVEFFGHAWGTWKRDPRRIAFWSDIVDFNNRPT